MMFDLDNFKSINDRFGHAVGDDALRAFASSVSASMRVHDVIGRLGGEEFATIVAVGPEIAARIAERVRSGFEKAGAEIAGHAVGATVSIGIVSAPADRHAVDWMIARADAALYLAKRNGRNRVEAAPLSEGTDRRQKQAEIRRPQLQPQPLKPPAILVSIDQNPSIH